MKKYVASACALLAFSALWYFFPHAATSGTAGSAWTASSTARGAEGAETPRFVPLGSEEYRNPGLNFSLLYPANLTAKEYTEQGGALTVTFENATGENGFQIYVVAYGNGNQIAKERFLGDEPSGVRKEPTDIVVDGTPATMFFGYNDVMGDTREVWFVKGGFLYEVNARKDLDEWLSQIMSTWRFI